MSRIDHDSTPSADRPAARPRPLHQRSGVRVVFIIAMLLMVVRLSGVMETLFYQPEAGPTPITAVHAGASKVSFATEDGETLVGWFIPARNVADPTKAATILHVHGNAGNITDHIGFSSHFADHGFNLFIFDYRGYGESTGSARRRAALLRDCHAALNTLLARTDIDTSRIGLYGQSLGGALGINLMAEREEIKAGLFVSSFDGWRSIAADTVGLGPIGRLLAWVLIEDHLRPDQAISQISRPVMLMHGTADEIIPIAHARRLRDASKDAALVELVGGDHNGLRHSHPEFDQQTADFFAQHLRSVDDESEP